MTTDSRPMPDWSDDTMKYVVSQGLPSDRPVVEKLVRACGKHVRDYFDMRNLDSYWNLGHVWLLHVNGVTEPVGFAVVYPQIRKPVLSLYDIGIHPEWRRFGLGTALMTNVWTWYQKQLGLKSMRLVVSEDNLTAIDTYRKWGLEPTERKATKRNGTVIVMEGVPWT